MATQKQIAEKLQISQQAVSASLGLGRGTVKVAPETRELVLKTARQIGYVPNHAARSLKSGKTGMIGVVMPFARDPYYSALIDALNSAASERKYSLLLQFHLWSELDEELAFRRLISARVEGILSYPRNAEHASSSLAAIIRGKKIPMVGLSVNADDRLFSGVVVKNYEEEGFLLGTRLLAAGHRRIDLLASSSHHVIQSQRMAGLQRAIKTSSVRAIARHVNLPAETLLASSPTAPAPENVRNRVCTELAEFYLGYQDKGSVVIVGNEAIAWKIMSVARLRGLHVPDDFSVACSGTLNEGDIGAVPLTASEYDVSEIARHSLDLLFNKKGPRRALVTPQIMWRASVKPLKGFR